MWGRERRTAPERSETLPSFSMGTRCSGSSYRQLRAAVSTRRHDTGHCNHRNPTLPRTEALRADCALRDLTIDFRRFGEPECLNFLQAVAANGNLGKVTLPQLPATANIDSICGVILHLRLEHRVRINDHHVSELDVTAPPKCSTISKVAVNGVSGAREAEGEFASIKIWPGGRSAHARWRPTGEGNCTQRQPHCHHANRN